MTNASMNPPTFTQLPLSEPIQQALAALHYSTPTPIQHKTIPLVLQGADVLGCAQTGTGKTAAFALPILDNLRKQPKPRLKNHPRVLVLAPTRELASQIRTSFEAYGKNLDIKSEVVFGGVSQFRQERAMQDGPEVLVATPGRLLDLMGGGFVVLKKLEVFVLDEADRMLDMGFIHDVKKVIAHLPQKRQTLFFSATMPPAIVELSQKLLTNPQKVMVTPESTTAERIDQHIIHVPGTRKREVLVSLLRKETEGLTLVFTATKHGANRVAETLNKASVPAAAIHGNKSQGARERALGDFREGTIRVLVATDIAARGIDVKGVGLVVNFDLPNEPESYVHRIGRTARAGADGRSISLVGDGDGDLLRQIERKIRLKIPEAPMPATTPLPALPPRPLPTREGSERGGQGQRQGNQGRQGQRQGQGRNRSGSNQNSQRPAEQRSASPAPRPATQAPVASPSRYAAAAPAATSDTAASGIRSGRYGGRRFRRY
jgi:ATP-dependent RNA helicase RhlE